MVEGIRKGDRWSGVGGGADSNGGSADCFVLLVACWDLLKLKMEKNEKNRKAKKNHIDEMRYL